MLGNKQEDMSTNKPKYCLRIYDNYHYMDESEAYDHGAFNTYDEALKAAKKIVLEHLEHNWKPGISPDELLATYNMYGKDPVIFPPDDDHPLFSAWEFAETIVEDFCEKMEDREK